MERILLIEDDTTLVALYRDLLEKEGYEVTVATDGQQGLQLATDTRPNIIILDIILPKMNGMQVLTHIRATEWGKKEPIIILTNIDPDDTQLQTVVHNQPTYYLLKVNTTPNQVLDKIRQVILEKKEKTASVA